MRLISPIWFVALASYATAASVNLFKRATPLKVELSTVGNSQVKIIITNSGDKSLNLLSKGTFLDEANPVEKVTMYAKGAVKVPFEGIKLRLLTSGLSPEDFLALAAGEKKELTVETAALHTLSGGGAFDVFAKGLLPYAEADSTALAGTLAYESNKLSMNINGAQAATVAKALSKRTRLGGSCTGSKLNAILGAISNCQRLATSAASAASAGTKLDTYFKSTSDSVKSTVSARLRAVAADCSGSSSATTTNCNDPYGSCTGSVLAYTLPAQKSIYYCDSFFSRIPALTSSCHAQDQATSVLHEETHADSVYNPGTVDYAYGYSAATTLSTSQALLNADSYALYANAIYVNC